MLLIDGIEYLVEKEIALLFGRSIHWFRKARYTGKTPHYYKLNGKVYYRVDAVTQWFKDNLKAM